MVAVEVLVVFDPETDDNIGLLDEVLFVRCVVDRQLKFPQGWFETRFSRTAL